MAKSVSLLLTALVVFALPWNQVVWVYVILGHGHFLVAYLYQYRAGKIDRGYLARYAAWALLLLGWCAWRPNLQHLLIVTTLSFLIHLSIDEMYLIRYPLDLSHSPLHLGRALEFAPLILLYMGRVVDSIYPGVALEGRSSRGLSWSVVLCLVALIPYGVLLVSRRYRPDGKSAYFFAWAFLLLLACIGYSVAALQPVKFFALIVLYHYFSWYLHYFLSLSSATSRRDFLTRVGLSNGFVFAVFWFGSGTVLETVLFTEQAYYYWALLHILSSTRRGDIKALIQLPQRGKTC